jgi:exopolyphosphatase/guanosine-5'-triphosphate,3'-diphosphate pyrophosphatase
VLYDLIDRDDVQTDVRATTVRRLASKFAADEAHAGRVSKVAQTFYRQLCISLGPEDLARHLSKLDWAAQLHEIGSQISHSDYHRHGAYILDHADAPGFAQPELHRLSQLVLGHRGKLKKLDVDFSDETFARQLMCLRLAVILCHARREPDLKGLSLGATGPQGRTLELLCRPGWARKYPQSAYLLAEEVVAWQKAPHTLTLTGF